MRWEEVSLERHYVALMCIGLHFEEYWARSWVGDANQCQFRFKRELTVVHVTSADLSCFDLSEISSHADFMSMRITTRRGDVMQSVESSVPLLLRWDTHGAQGSTSTDAFFGWWIPRAEWARRSSWLVGVCARDFEREDFASGGLIVEGRHRHVLVHRAHEPLRTNQTALIKSKPKVQRHDTLGSEYVIWMILLHCIKHFEQMRYSQLVCTGSRNANKHTGHLKRSSSGCLGRIVLAVLKSIC